MYDLANPVLLGPVQNQEHYMNGVIARRNNFYDHIPEFLEAAYEEFGELTGRVYGPLTEYKTKDADTVFISLGSAAENIDLLEHHFANSTGNDHQLIDAHPPSIPRFLAVAAALADGKVRIGKLLETQLGRLQQFVRRAAGYLTASADGADQRSMNGKGRPPGMGMMAPTSRFSSYRKLAPDRESRCGWSQFVQPASSAIDRP